jgi:hypothetical protein
MSTAASSAIFHHETVIHRCGWQLRLSLAHKAGNR